MDTHRMYVLQFVHPLMCICVAKCSQIFAQHKYNILRKSHIAHPDLVRRLNSWNLFFRIKLSFHQTDRRLLNHERMWVTDPTVISHVDRMIDGTLLTLMVTCHQLIIEYLKNPSRCQCIYLWLTNVLTIQFEHVNQIKIISLHRNLH